jgi:large repetitive protein
MNTPLLPGGNVSYFNRPRAVNSSSLHPIKDEGVLNQSTLFRPSSSKLRMENVSKGMSNTRVLLLIISFFISLSTAWSQVDLSLSKKIDKSKPVIGETITYSIIVKNTGILPATGVVVKDSLPAGGVSYLGNVLVRGGVSYTASSGLWNVGTVAPGDSAILNITAKVEAQGVYFNVAEVQSMNEEDMDSWPGDGALDQDDIATTCFSVPLDWYPGDEFTVSVPSGYKGIKWFYNGSPINGSTIVGGVTIAVVNVDSTLTIMGPGSYTFISTVGVSCPATGCCAIEIVPGPIFDLALSKTLAPGQAASVAPGALVKFRLTVTNEGSVAATQIALSDSLPAGLTLADAAWTAVGNIATLNTPLAGPLASGATAFVDITVKVDANYTSGTLTNYAQIKDAKDGQGNPVTDKDSTPGNGFNNGEDDRDSEPINVSPAPIFDLALSKTLAPGQAASVAPGALVKFRLTVTNEGSVAATQIALSDSLPAGLTLADAAWTAVGNIATLNTPLAGPLASGATAFVDITVKVSETYLGTSLLNYAQIKDAKDGQGNPVTDKDSTPGNGFNNGEDDRDSEPITISQCPVITLTTTPDKVICVGESVILNVTSSVSGTTINWYTAPTGGTPFVTTASGANLTLSPTQTTTYYVEGTLQNGCKSNRVPIMVTVNAKPTTPVASGNIQNTCPATTADLTSITLSQASTPGGVYEWHVSASPTSALVADPTKVGAGTYYIFEKSVAGCYSNALAVVVNIIPCDCQLVYGVSAGPDREICAGLPITVTATTSGTVSGITWSTSGTGTFANATSLNTTYLPSASDIAAGGVTLTVTTNDPDGNGTCVPKMDALSVVINPQPTPAFGVACDDTLLCLGKSTKLIGFAPGSTIKWYTTPTGGTSIGSIPSGGKLTVTPTATTTYYAEAISEKGCISGERTPVTVVVKPCFSDLAVVKTVLTPGPYSPGQEINYSVTVKNLGIGNAASVTVADVLPASLQYVTSAPAAEYNPGTGIWTIGSMINGSNRVLVITAKIRETAAGTITNTAIVRSPDNDPNNTSNDTSSVTIRVDNIADLMLAKKVSKVNPAIGETITYTLEVSNSGPQKATNIEVTDQLPAGLEFVSSTDFSKTGNLLKGTIASVEVGATKTLSFLAKVVSGTTITNIAQISKADQKDPDSTPGNGYSNGEDDEASVTVNVGCPTIDPPVIACAETNVCIGTAVTLTAVGCKDGTLKWSNGMEGASITVTLTETTTFTAQCQKGECKSAPSNPITITIATPVKPVLASNVSSVCAGGSATLTASNCNGVLVWSTGATGTPLVVTPSTTTTYTAYCKKNNCVSETASITIQVGQPGPPPIITCGKMDICPGESVVLTAHECEGVVKWSNGQTGTSITVSPMTTTSYSAKCIVGTCESVESEKHTIHVSKPEAPVIASSKLNVCPGASAMLTATNCEGIVKWSNGQTGTSISVTLSATKSFTATCKTDVCESGESNVVTINVGMPTTPIIASDKTVICSGDSVKLTATGCSGTVNWSNGRTGASIYVSPSSTTSYTAKCKVEDCESGVSNTVTINVNTSGTAPVIAASKTDICAGNEVTLTATGCTGTVKWSNGDSGASIKVTPVATSIYTATCKTASGTCASGPSNQVTIQVSPVTPPVLTATKLSICQGDSVTLSAAGCSGIVKWSNGMTGASIKVKPNATTTFTATCEKGTCVSGNASITINVTTTPPPTVVCSTDSICKGGSVTLLIENCQGTAKWSTGQTGVAIVVSPTVTTSYTAKCLVNGCESASSIGYKITVFEPAKPILTASKNPINSGESTIITATGCENGRLEWSNAATGNSITVSPTSTMTYSAICILKECTSDTAKITIKVNVCDIVAPTITANTPTVCIGGEVTLKATGCTETVVWSNGQTGASITVPLTATRTFTATCKASDLCTSPVSNAVTVSVTKLGIPTITASAKNICIGDSVKLSAVGCEGTVVWSNGMTGANILVKPSVNTTYSAKCTLGSCESDASLACTITIGKPQTPTITTAASTVCFGESVTLTASGCSGNGFAIWSNGLVGNSITISPAQTTTFTVQCCTSSNCKSDASTPVTVTVAPKVAKPITRNVTNACPVATANLVLGVTGLPKSIGGIFVYRKGNSPESAVVDNPTQVGAGTYYVFEKTIAGCFSEPSVIVVTITDCADPTACKTNPATANAGNDATICAATSYKLAGTIGGAATSSTWTTSGTGTFSDPTALSATYTPSMADIEKGTVTLTLKTDDPDGAGTCQPAMDEMVLTLENIKIRPSIAINGVAKTDTTATTLTVCAGDSVVLTALDILDANSSAYTYKWNGGTATSSTRYVIKTSGTYSLMLINKDGCTSIASPKVIVVVKDPLAKPIVSNKRNTCPATTVDLATAITGSPAAGNSYVYRIGASPMSNEIVSPQAVGAGTYYVFEKSGAGCYSEPGKIEVNIVDCTTDTLKTDLAIFKSVDKTTVNKGGEVTYSIKIKNNGPINATNITILDVLPAGIEYIAGAGYSIEGNVIKGVIPMLAANDSLIFSCAVKVIGEGTIKNVVTIANFDQIDSNLANNVSEVSIVATGGGVAHANSIGVAKLAGTPVKISNGVYDVPYTIMVKNLGTNDLTKVQVVDDLSLAFGNGAVIVPGSISVTADAGFTVNTLYTGNGANTGLLVDSLSTLPKGMMRDIMLTVRVDVNNATTTTFNNVAMGSGMGAANVMVADSSTVGNNPDPDNDLDPTNDTSPTPIVLNNVPGEAAIGVALAVKDTVRQSDGSYNITYMAIVKNYGSVALTNVQVTDSLLRVFNTQTGATFRKVGTPIANSISELAINPDFDGLNDMELLISSNSRLNAGATDTLTYTINVSTDGRDTPYMNWVYASAKFGETTVSDKSTNGLQPDLNGNNDPTEASENELTPIVIPGGTQLFIPEGFSPNGDGINDYFVIRNTGGQKVIVEIYNRWMTLVYKNDDYKNDWDGTTNNGLRVGSTSQGLPDGTYFYVVKLENGKQFVRYMTIAR